jgi:response regulator RpfG family c-di-GMP phosphodiesterase
MKTILDSEGNKAAVSAGFHDFRNKSGSNLPGIELPPDANAMLELLCEVGKKVGSVPRIEKLVENITQMTQQTLKAAASSILLFDDGREELLFEVAEGKAGKALKQISLSPQSGIAGWVARYGKPLIVNDVTTDQRFERSIDEITGFVTRSILCVPLAVHRRVIGVIEVLNKLDGSDFNAQDLETLTSVASTAAMAIENTKLNQTILEAYKGTIKALAAAIDAKDHYTRGHSQRVMEYALLGGTSLSFSQEESEVLEYASTLHDIGKIGIADSILSKPAPLTYQEWKMIIRHPQIGADILNDVTFLEEARKLILHHHEMYDGNGYPAGLKYDEIPMGARLLAVADAFDTMTTDRAYRASLGIDHAIEELYRCSGTQFCPVAVKAFVSGYSEHT